MPVDGLLAAWRADVASAGGVDDHAGEELLERWSEPHRRYHDVDHLTAMLSHVDDLSGGAADPAVRLATWFHDAVYDPTSAGNEEASAALAGETLPRLGIPAAITDEVIRLVRMTASHDPTPDDHAGALICDADLAILAARPSAYQRYTEAVRAEYHHVDDATFRAGRTAILQRLLRRPTLYNLDAARHKWEGRARINLAIELSALTAGVQARKPLAP